MDKEYPNTDNRRFPRIDHVSSKQIVRLEQGQSPKNNLILTQNVSAAGFCFTTTEQLTPATFLLIYINDQVMREINKTNKSCVRSGDYYLAKVVWIKDAPGQDCYEVGTSFVDKKKCSTTDMDTFTELINASMLDKLPPYIGQVRQQS